MNPILVSFLVSLALNLVSAMLFRAGQPKQQPPMPGKFDSPKATEGEPIGYVIGTDLVKDPVIHWVGGQWARAVTRRGGGKK